MTRNTCPTCQLNVQQSHQCRYDHRHYAVRSVLEGAHDRMHTMLSTHKTDPDVPISLERLRRKIPTALGARAVAKIVTVEVHGHHSA